MINTLEHCYRNERSGSSASSPRIDFDALTDRLGGFGRYQKILYFFACLVSLMTGTTAIIVVFLDYIPKHRCYVPGCDTDESSSNEDFLNFTTPFLQEENIFDSCHLFATFQSPNESLGNCSEEIFDQTRITNCSKWVYDKTVFTSTVVSTFNLVCDEEFFVSLGSATYMAGNLIGSPALGHVSDTFGRKVGLSVSALLFGICGVAGVFSSNYVLYLVLRFLIGMGAMGCFEISFIIAIEYMGAKWRTFCGIVIMIPFALGEALTGCLAYLYRDWRWVQITCTAPGFLVLSYQWFFPESIRWLVSKNRIKDAMVLVDKAAEANKLPSPSYMLEDLLKNANEEVVFPNHQKKSVLNIFRFANMRKRTFLLAYCWIVCALSYYGLSSNAGNLSGNLFLNYVSLMIIEIPSYIVAYFLLDKIGRRGTLAAAFITGGVASFLSGLLPRYLELLIVTTSLLGKFGVAAAFGCIYVYTAELYPTEYRGVGVGVCSSFSRIGSMLAPMVAGLAKYYLPLPLLIFGVLAFVAGLLILRLPETLGYDLPQTLEECENFGNDEEDKFALNFDCCVSKETDVKEEKKV